MESKTILEKVKSQYILQIIFEYINNYNFKYDLIKYSKFWQTKFGIGKNYYQALYFNKIDMNFTNYFNKYILCPDVYDKNILNKNLEDDLTKYKIKLDVLKEYINEQIKIPNLKEKYEYFINIYSPFFDEISKSEFFEQKFCLPINIKTIKKHNLKKDYSLAMQKLNKSNLKYPAIEFIYKNGEDVNYFNELKLNFKFIKKLYIHKEFKEYLFYNDLKDNGLYS